MRVEAERRQVLLAHHVVQVDAGAGHHLAAALPVRARHRAGPALVVGRRDVGGGAEPARGEALEEAGVGEPGEERRRPLGLGGLHRGDDGGDRRRRHVAVEQRERPREQDAARARRRVGQDGQPAVADPHRRARDRRVGGEVLTGQQPAARADPVRHRRGDRAGVERRRALGGEQLERVGERRVAVDLADPQRHARGHQQGARLRGRRADRREDREQVRLLLVDLDAVARGAHGGRDERVEREPAEALGGRGGAGHRAVRAGRRGADVERLHGVAEVDVDRPQRRRLGAGRQPAAGRLDEEVEQHRLRVRRRDEHVAARPEPGEHRLADERHEHRRERGVHGVAAGAEGVRAGTGGDGMARGDDAAHSASACGLVTATLGAGQNLGMYSGTSTSMPRESRSLARQAAHARLAGRLAQAGAALLGAAARASRRSPWPRP